jgi:hypothetical protein
VNEASFFKSRDYFDAPPGCRADPLKESAGIPSVAQRAGCNYPDSIGSRLLRRTVKTTQHLYCESDCFWRQQATAEYGFTQSGDFAVFMDFDQPMSYKPRYFKANGVRSDINRGKGRHSATV